MNICIFTVILNEQEYLDDFLDYHTKMGIDIFVMEDVDSLPHKSICDKYDNVYLSSILDIFPKEQHNEIIQMRKDKIPPQTLYINQGLKYIHSLNKYDWCWLIDIDEYITSTEPISSVLGRFNDRDAVLLYWKNFGVSGRLKKPIYDKPIYEIYTEPCGYELFSDFKFYKITKFCVNLNKWKPEHKYWIHNAPRNWVKADGTYKRTGIVYEPLYLRHYITKSVEEYLHKILIRGMFHPTHRQLQSLYEMCPETRDMIDDVFREYFKNKYGVEIPSI